MAEARMMATSDIFQAGRFSIEYIERTNTLMRPKFFKGESTLEVVFNMFGMMKAFVKSKVRSLHRGILNFLFPTSPFSWYTTVIGCGAARYMLPALGDKVDTYIPFINAIKDPNLAKATSIALFGTVVWLGGVIGSRLTLKVLLMYKGFLYDHPRHPSLLTRAWLGLLWLFEGGGKPMTYSYQSVLPRLPVPSLKETCRRYLDSVRPLLDPTQYARVERLAQEFLEGEGWWLQAILIVKSWFVTNYVTDWWEAFVYLYGRDSIMINSNYYIMDAYSWTPTNNAVSRAANLIFHIVQYQRQLEKEQLPPLMVNGLIPLCMAQYERSFGTTRIPGKGKDVIQHVPKTKHVAIYCKGHFFIFNTVGNKGEPLTALHYERQLEKVVKMATECEEPAYGEEHLPAMTGANRDTWADFRETFLGTGVNAASLDAIERASFFVVLDESSPEHPNETAASNPFARSLIHGNGYNRWFDKSFCVVVHKNGRVGFNAEHAWADAPVCAQLLETILAEEFKGIGYDSTNGKNKAVPTPKVKMAEPILLHWKFNDEAEAIIKECLVENQEQIADLDLCILRHTSYSKGFIKKCKTSPDAWMQMALQLAYFKETGGFAQTYEASMTRLYLHGRTETVRPVSEHSVAFVRAMADPALKKDKEECKRLFKLATESHVHQFKDSMAGKGIDRHLFCLYVASKIMKKDSKFLSEALGSQWVLSTSQTPVQQTTLFDLKNNLDKATGGGGFGPVADDGYGISYIIASDVVVNFHITCKVSSSKTDATGFAGRIQDAMADIKALFETPEDGAVEEE